MSDRAKKKKEDDEAWDIEFMQEWNKWRAKDKQDSERKRLKSLQAQEEEEKKKKLRSTSLDAEHKQRLELFPLDEEAKRFFCSAGTTSSSAEKQ
jgi:hypothetical protein